MHLPVRGPKLTVLDDIAALIFRRASLSLLRAFAIQSEFADDILSRHKLVGNKAVLIEWHLNPHGHFAGCWLNAMWADTDLEIGYPQRVHDSTSFVGCFTTGATGYDRFAATFVDRVVSRVSDHSDSTEFKCRKKA